MSASPQGESEASTKIRYWKFMSAEALAAYHRSVPFACTSPTSSQIFQEFLENNGCFVLSDLDPPDR
jgi:hypothetical protein